MQKPITIFFFIFTFFISFAQQTAKVIGITDGDTIIILLEVNIQKRLRLAEVDCPESGQPFGKNAKQFTSSQVFGRIITFVETDTDKYGRTIAKVYYNNGKYLSAEIIKAGYGWWYYRYSTDTFLGDLQNQAKAQKLGLWQDENAVEPWEWRRK